MLIRTQNKEGIIDAVNVYIVTVNGGFKNTFRIDGDFAGASEERKNTFKLGHYSDKELAISELDNIMQFFMENPSGIYQMR